MTNYDLAYKQENAHDDAIWSVAWAKSETDGVERIVTGSLDDTVKAWKCNEDAQLELQYIFDGHSLGVASVDTNHTGTVAASNSLDSHIRLWNLESGEQIQNISAGPVNAWTVAFSPDSEFVATCTQTGKVVMYSTQSGKQIGKELDSNNKFILCIGIRKDCKQIATGSMDGMIRLFDVESGILTTTLEGHAMPIRSLTFSPDGKYLITGSDDCHIKIYDVHSGELINTLSGHGSWVLSVDFSPDNKYFASSSSDKTVKVWDVLSRECLHTFTTHTDQVWGVKYSPCGKRLVSASEDRSIAIFNCA